MILGITEAVVALLSIMAMCVTIAIIMRMSLEHGRKIRQMQQDYDYQMRLLSNEHELLAITPRAKAQVEVLDAQTRAARQQIRVTVDPEIVEAVVRGLTR